MIKRLLFVIGGFIFLTAISQACVTIDTVLINEVNQPLTTEDGTPLTA